MSKDTVKSEAEKPTAENKKPEKTAQKFALEKLKENSMTLFGVSESTFTGATYGLNGEYTIAEMKAIINNWKHKEAK